MNMEGDTMCILSFLFTMYVGFFISQIMNAIGVSPASSNAFLIVMGIGIFVITFASIDYMQEASKTVPATTTDETTRRW